MASTVSVVFMCELRQERRYCIAMFTRREFGRLAFAGLVSPKFGLLEPERRRMRGVFIILTTPFTAAGEVDWDDLARETAFVDRCDCHGVVWPQGSSGVANLTKAERL